MMKLLVVFIVSILTISSGAKLPSSFMKCNRKDKDFLKCTPVAVHDAMRKMTKPIKELGLPSLNPLEVTELTIEAGTRAVGVRQVFKNLKIYGINNVECSKMDVDFEKKTIENLCFYPEIKMLGNYELDGKVLLLDVRGKGPGSVVLEKVKIGVSYKYEELKKNDLKYIKIIDIVTKIDPEKVQFHIDNAFNGLDKTISDNIIQVINDNWKEVFDDVKSGYQEAFGHIIKVTFNNLLAKVPLSELFGEE